MRFKMQHCSSAEQLRRRNWEIIVAGPVIDARGKAAVDFASNGAQEVISLRYDPTAVEIAVDGKAVSADDLAEVFARHVGKEFLLETTTLGFAEMYLVCKAAKDLGIPNLAFLYTEPRQYRIRERGEVLDKRDFELSDVVEDFATVPGGAIFIRSERTRSVFFLGYEGQRFEQALEQTNVRPDDCAVVFGVPAFKPGWEMDSFANNIRIITEHRIGELLFTGAQNPAGAYGVLQGVYESCEMGQRLLIGPIGTKPHGIGTALFACDHPEVGILYDHPMKKEGRTKDVSDWHLFEADL